MSSRGRFGKYGDLKRKAILRKSRLSHLDKVSRPGLEDEGRRPKRRRKKGIVK